MKYALVFVLIGLVFWMWRSQRLTHKKKSDGQTFNRSTDAARTLGPLTEIVACAVCKVHLPKPEAVMGSRGVYCSAAHRQQAHD